MDCLLDTNQRHKLACFSCCFSPREVSPATLPASLACSSAAAPYSFPNDVTSAKRPATLSRQSFKPVGSHPAISTPYGLQERRFVSTFDTDPTFWVAEGARSRVNGTGWGYFPAKNHTERTLPAYRTGQDSEHDTYEECYDVNTVDSSSGSVEFKSRWSISTTQTQESIDTLDEDFCNDTEASSLHEDDEKVVIFEAFRISRDTVALSPTRVDIIRTSRHEAAQDDTQENNGRSSQAKYRKRWGVIFSEEEARIYRF
ncbi:hypothetical protein ACHAPJ_012706 [Fusarium lateritium]